MLSRLANLNVLPTAAKRPGATRALGTVGAASRPHGINDDATGGPG